MGRFCLFCCAMLGVFALSARVEAGTVVKVDGDDIYLNMGQANGVQIGTIFNVYRNKEVESGFGSLTFKTRVFIGRIYAYKFSGKETVARVRKLSDMMDRETQKAVLKDDLIQPVFLISSDELFGSNNVDIQSSAKSKLDQLVRFIKRFTALKVRVEAHTDNQAEDANKLSHRQAQSLCDWLVQAQVVDKSILVPIGYGAQKPVAPNDSEANRSLNRRIEVVIED